MIKKREYKNGAGNRLIEITIRDANNKIIECTEYNNDNITDYIRDKIKSELKNNVKTRVSDIQERVILINEINEFKF